MIKHDETDLEQWADDCRAQLRSHVDNVDAQVQGRLADARRRALIHNAHESTSRPFRVPGVWLPAAVVGFAGALAVAVWVARPVAPTPVSAEVAAVEDAELLVAGDETDLYAEDAAFYEWAGGQSGSRG